MNKFDYVKKQREEVDPIPEKWVWLIKKIMKVYTKLNIWVYKNSNGRLMKNFPGGEYPICIVTMTGKKSGLERETALLHLPHGDKKLLVASQGGMNKHPVWYFNIKANPKIKIFHGGVKRPYMTRQLSSQEKADVWPHLVSLYPDFDEYQARTDRDIPVFVCDPLIH